MTSNSKLTGTQKFILRDWLDIAIEDNIQVVNMDNVTTMAYRDCGDNVEFSTAVMSSNEKKFRAKVGQYHALERFFDGKRVIMRRIDFQIMCENVWDFWGL